MNSAYKFFYTKELWMLGDQEQTVYQQIDKNGCIAIEQLKF